MSKIHFFYQNDFDISKSPVKDLNIYLRTNPIVERYHVLAFGSGSFVVTDMKDNHLCIYPSSGLLDVYYFMKFLCGKLGLECSYCVEELYTLDEFDDEYCIHLDEKVHGMNSNIQIKSNKQNSVCIFNLKDFIVSLIPFVDKLIKLFSYQFTFLESSPIIKEIESMNLELKMMLNETII